MVDIRTMEDYVNGRCMAVEDSKRFVDDWIRSRGFPCLRCRTVFKSICTLYGDKREVATSERPAGGRASRGTLLILLTYFS